MEKIKSHPLVKLFAAITFREKANLEKILLLTEELFGEIDIRSKIYNFSIFTDYYSKEMGSSLQKLFVSFESMINAESLPDLKIKSNGLEKHFLKSNKRTVNIDPGCLTEAKIVLATTKDYIHRLYLKKGIYGDLHLYFENKSFQAQSWTYPDYKQKLSIQFFNEVRDKYREQLRIQKFNTL